MSPPQRWIFVDDVPDAAQAFADRLSKDTGLTVEVIGPETAKAEVLSGKLVPHGVLMDVDLSAAPGENGTGPGIAQDIRVKQKARAISEFPVVRFAAIAPVEKNLKGDPASDDLFDLKIQKEALTKEGGWVVEQLHGLLEIYSALAEESPDESTFLKFLDISPDRWARVGHVGLQSRVLTGLQAAPHVAAGSLLRDFLLPAGLLIGEDLLAIRLGIDARQSAEEWFALRESLPFRYTGVASSRFVRWWARDLETWWLEAFKGVSPLASLTSVERVNVLTGGQAAKKLTPLTLPNGSAGSKPWRLCSLVAEREPKELLPIDPLESVRFMPRTDLPAWVDPQYAALGPALQERNDFRLNQSDLSRLSKKYR